MAFSFVNHSFIWSDTRLEPIYRDRVVDLTIPSVISVRDSSYKSMLVIGLVISLVSLAGLICLAIRRRTAAGEAR